MINNFKLKSYALLMAHNIDRIVERSIANLRKNCKDPEELQQFEIVYNTTVAITNLEMYDP